jgi:hypothetical protein
VKALLAIASVITLGAKKYEPYNWQKLDRFDDRFYAAALRHLLAWRGGELLDPETGLPHLAHAGCNVVFLLSKQLGFEGLATVPAEEKRCGTWGENETLRCHLLEGHLSPHCFKCAHDGR